MRLTITLLEDLINQSLPLQTWKFVQDIKTDSFIIYNSEWCRIKFVIDHDMTQDYLHIYYGRLHALNNEMVMSFEGKNCYCWYHHTDIKLMLEFLDGASPQSAYKRRLSPLPLFQDFFNSKTAKLATSPEERYLKLHALIWKHYGIRFFELFDLRRSDLWEQYKVFIKEFYKVEGLNPDIDPPLYQIC